MTKNRPLSHHNRLLARKAGVSAAGLTPPYPAPEPEEGALAANIAHGEGAQTLTSKVGRNEKCPCGSEVKYKNCCGR